MTDSSASQSPGAAQDATAGDDAHAKSFESIVARLEAIATCLETGDAKLEEALTLFEEGVALSLAGGQKLDAAERKLERLMDTGQVETIPESQVMPSGASF